MNETYALILCRNIVKKGEMYVLDELTKSRVNVGIELLRRGEVEKIILSGGCAHIYGISISSVMKRYAISQGADSKDILEEDLSRDTVGQLIFTKLGIIKPKKVQRISVVTNRYHLNRVKKESEFIFGNGYVLHFEVASGNDDERTSMQEGKSLNEFMRTFEGLSHGDDEAILRRFLLEHPLYRENSAYFRDKLTKLKVKNENSKS